MLDKLFGLEKLTIRSYKPTAGITGSPLGAFQCMFNPAHYSEKYKINYERPSGLDGYSSESRFTSTDRKSLELDLILDGNGVNELALIKTGPKPLSVKEQIKLLLALAYQPSAQATGARQPNLLVLSWGNGLNFQGRLEKFDIKYTQFDKSGQPLHAQLNSRFVAYESLATTAKRYKLKLTDSTRQQLVKSGEILPLKSQEVYNDSSRYLEIAKVNRLNNFRKLEAGQKLTFPPIKKG